MEPSSQARVQALLAEAFRGREAELTEVRSQCCESSRTLVEKLDSLLARCTGTDIKQRISLLQKYSRLIQTIEKDLGEIATLSKSIDSRLSSIEDTVEGAVATID